MPKYQPAPELAQALADPIEFTVAGKEFVLPKITNRMVSAFAGLGDKPDSLAVLEVFIGSEARELDPDIRELVPLLNWLASMMGMGLGAPEKNALEPSPQSPDPSQDSLGTATS